MWLVPHFLGVDVAGMATQIFQKHRGFDVYAPQSNEVLDKALLRGRSRFGTADFYTRQDGARPIVRAIRQGHAFFNPCDMDFGLRDAAFVPFFGHPAAWTDWPSEDPVADAARMNRFIETQIRLCPAQYLWVHKRFKTRPPGEPSFYA